MISATIPPVGTGAFELHGYCMDPALPAPGAKDLLRFIKARRFYDGQFDGFDQQLLEMAAARNLPRDQIQHILWGMRGLREASSYTLSLANRSDLLAIMEAAQPGIAQKFVRAVNTARATKALSAEIQRAFSTALGGNNSFPNQLIRELLDPSSGSMAIQRHIDSLSRPVEGRHHVSVEAAFSKLAEGIYAQSVGIGSLQVRAIVLNMTDRPYVFQPSEWVGESMLPQQRVAFSGFMNKPSVASFDADVGDFDLPAYATDVGKLLRDKALGTTTPERAQKLARMTTKFAGDYLRMYEPRLMEVARYVPIVGNVWSLSEAFDETKSKPERILAAFGSIPGYGSLFKLAGSARQVGNIARTAIEAAPGFTKMIDKTGWLRDIAEVGMITVNERDEKLWEVTHRTVSDLLSGPPIAGQPSFNA